MPLGLVSGVGRGRGILDGVVIVEGKGADFWGSRLNVGHHIVTSGDCGVVIVCHEGGDAAFPKLLCD